MDTRSIVENFYKAIAKRVSEKVKRSGLSLSSIYPNDPKLVSHIQNCKRTKNNPYLLTNAVIETWDSDGSPYGLLHKLPFSSTKEILWGTEDEIESYQQPLFVALIEILLGDKSDIDINELLYDYIPYAKWATYWEILYESETPNQYPAILWGIYEDDVCGNLDCSRESAILFLWDKCGRDFKIEFTNFINEIDSFKKIDCKFKNDFIEKRFMPLLKKYKPGSESLGLRVRNLILSDLSIVPKLLSNFECVDTEKQLVNASSYYIVQLEKIQKSI